MKKLFTLLTLACAFLAGNAAEVTQTVTLVGCADNNAIITDNSSVSFFDGETTLFTLSSNAEGNSKVGTISKTTTQISYSYSEEKFNAIQLAGTQSGGSGGSNFTPTFDEEKVKVTMYIVNSGSKTETLKYNNNSYNIEVSGGTTVEIPLVNNVSFNLGSVRFNAIFVITYTKTIEITAPWSVNYAEIASTNLPYNTNLAPATDLTTAGNDYCYTDKTNNITIGTQVNNFQFQANYNGTEIISKDNVTSGGNVSLRFGYGNNSSATGLFASGSGANRYGILSLQEGDIVEIAISGSEAPSALINLEYKSQEEDYVFTFNNNGEQSVSYKVYRYAVKFTNSTYTSAALSVATGTYVAYIKVNSGYTPEKGYYLVGNMTADYDGGWNPNPSYKFQQNKSEADSSDSETAVTTYTLTVSSMSSSNEFYVVYVNDEGDQTVYSLDTSKDSSLEPENENYDLSSTYKNPLKLNGSYLNLTFTLTPDAQPDATSTDGPFVNLYYSGTIDNNNNYIITPGNDQTMQSGEFITENNNSVLVITTVSNGALAYIYIPSSLTEVYYSLTSGEIVATDVTLTKANIQTDNVGNFFTVPLVVDTKGTISVYPTQGGSAAETFYFRVVNGTPLGVEAVEAVEGEVEYFNLQGVKIANPDHGIFIKVQNGKASKVIL